MPLRALYQRFQVLIHELAKFGIIGGLSFVVDAGLFYLFTTGTVVPELHPVAAKTISTIVASTLAYVGNRIWTFRHRSSTDVRREYIAFVIINGLTLGISLGMISIAHDALGLGTTAVNLVNLLSIAVGTVIRFVAYKRFVFVAPGAGEAALAHHAAEELGDPVARVAAAAVVHDHEHASPVTG